MNGGTEVDETYRALFVRFSPPTSEQIRNFCGYVCRKHSWYKKDAATLVARWEAAGVEVLHVDYGIRRDGEHAAIVEATAEAVAARLAAGRRVHIHCAAGMHRTGRVAYASLRRLGLSCDDAIAEISRTRPVTDDAVATLVANDSGSVES